MTTRWISWLYQVKSEGERTSWWMGCAHVRLWSLEVVTLIVPLHWLFRWGTSAWYGFKFPSAKTAFERRCLACYRKGHEAGRLVGQAEASREFQSWLSQEDKQR